MIYIPSRPFSYQFRNSEVPDPWLANPHGWPWKSIVLLVFVAIQLAVVSAAQGSDWLTSRGNVMRTGSADGSSGPKSNHILWVYTSNDHYVAAPVAAADTVLVSSLAAFNTSSFLALSTDPHAGNHLRWMKSAPALKLPTVCAPAVKGNLVVFGDGMHQTDGAVLHGIRLDNGLPLWEFPVPGQLVHLEGSPTIVNGRVVFGGGNAGVICVDPTHLELDGKPVTAAAAQALQEAKWKQLQAKFEQEKKTDPDFAIPPSEEALPKPKPKLVWQQGAEAWHVDAPVAVAGDFVLAASAHLDQEKIGDRALHCLSLFDGVPAWRMKLKYNPWAGATVAGETVLVGCSSVRFEPKDIPRAQGEVIAASLSNGVPKWRKPLPAGVLSSIAVQGSLAVFTATDGRVRAWDVDSSEERWATEGGTPFFAGPAIAGNTVYVADLKGKIQALNLSDGKRIWDLDLANSPAVQAPGMVYGGPIVAGGRLYVATCNFEATGKASTAVVCIGEK